MESANEKLDRMDRLDPGSPADPVPFGKYLLMGLIARGGMAEVYRARSRTSSRLYAIKCMRPQLAKESRFVDMFVREGRLAVLLEHQNIVRTYEIGRTDGRYFIAMEYIGGKDLTQVLRRCQEQNGRIPVPHACFIAAKMAEGLHYAHTLTESDGRPLAIVNRDVSPSNVRIGYDGEVKLLDFGIAQAMVKFTSEIGVLKGKFSYMSPEQIRGMPVDARTDVFSTGIILHEMLTTEKLFRGDTEFQLMERVRNAEVVPPSKFNRRVPEELDRVVLKALARDVADRYQTAADLAADLHRFLEPYRFEPKELMEQIRSLFRSDYDREAQETMACQRAKIPSPADAEREGSMVVNSAGMSLDGVQMVVEQDDGAVVQAVTGTESTAPHSAMQSAAPAAARPAADAARTPEEPPVATSSEKDPAGPPPEPPSSFTSETSRPSGNTNPKAGSGLWARIRGKFIKS
jgi:serine/threonine protein kinase